MEADAPVIEISGVFADEIVAGEVADALNRWFAWIVEGSEPPVPELFEPLGVPTEDWAWKLTEDVDWELGPHARAVGEEVRISLNTRDTYRHVARLLRLLGARAARIHRET